MYEDVLTSYVTLQWIRFFVWYGLVFVIALVVAIFVFRGIRASDINNLRDNANDALAIKKLEKRVMDLKRDK